MDDQTTLTGAQLKPFLTPGSVAEEKYYWALAEAELKKNEGVYADFQKIQRENRRLQIARLAGGKHQSTIGEGASVQTKEIVDELLQNAQDLRKKTESTAWKLPFKVRKHEVTLRDCLKEVVKALKLFKDVGSVIASLDRVHAGIPWAAVNVVLEESRLPTCKLLNLY